MKVSFLFITIMALCSGASPPNRKRLMSNVEWRTPDDIEFGRNQNAWDEILLAEEEMSRVLGSSSYSMSMATSPSVENIGNGVEVKEGLRSAGSDVITGIPVNKVSSEVTASTKKMSGMQPRANDESRESQPSNELNVAAQTDSPDLASAAATPATFSTLVVYLAAIIIGSTALSRI